LLVSVNESAVILPDTIIEAEFIVDEINEDAINEFVVILLLTVRFCASNSEYTILLVSVNESAVILPDTTIESAFNEDVVILLVTCKFVVSS